MSNPIGSILYTTSAPAIGTPGASGTKPGDSAPFRPPQWNTGPAFTMTATDPNSGQQVAYVFDNGNRILHEQESVVTMNPVQTGAALSDNIYLVPARVVIEVMMSDAMQSFNVSQWNNGPSKSVSAYQTLVALQQAGNPVQIASRLRQYANMMIVGISAEENKDTRFGLRATVTFREIITAQIQANSSRLTGFSEMPQTTDETQIGQSQTLPVPQSIQNQNNVENSGLNLTPVPQVSGAGQWSSYNVAGLDKVIG